MLLLRKAVSKDLSTSIFEQLFRVLVGLGGPQIRASGGVFLGLPAALGRSWGLGRRGLFLSDFGCHSGPLLGSKIGLGTPQERQVVETIGFCGGICVCAICARSATILQIERKSNKITVKSHTKNTLPRKLETTSKKCRFESQNASQNRSRRPGRAPGSPPSRDFRQNNFHFWLLPGSKSASKSKLEFDAIFERF